MKRPALPIRPLTSSHRTYSTRNISHPFSAVHSPPNTNNNTINSETTTPYPYSPRPHKTLKPQPNSNRTLNPSLQTLNPTLPSSHSRNYIMYISNKKSNSILNPGSPNHLLNYCKSNYKSRPIDIKKYRSFKFTYEDKEIEDNEKYKRHKKETQYGKYNFTTQIYALPGGVKRGVLEKKRSNNKLFIGCSNMKINSDYRSKIECLPTAMTIHSDDKGRRNEKNVFRKGKKTVGNVNMYTESNPEYCNQYVTNTNCNSNVSSNINTNNKHPHNKTHSLNIETNVFKTGKKIHFGPNSPNHFKSSIVLA